MRATLRAMLDAAGVLLGAVAFAVALVLPIGATMALFAYAGWNLAVGMGVGMLLTLWAVLTLLLRRGG